MPNKKIQSLTVQGVTYDIVDNTSGYTSNTGTITSVKTTAGAHTTINVSSGAAEFNVPTKTSHLTNDSGFLTSSDIASVLTYKGTKASVANLPSTGNKTGDVWHITADGSEYAWDGSIWQELGTAIDLSGYATKATTLSGYGITDAKIENGTITLGSNSITPLTSFTETDPVFSASAAAGITSTDISNWNAKISDDKTWNGVTLNKSEAAGNDNYYLTGIADGTTTSTTARLIKATVTPEVNRIPKYGVGAYLYSTTPSANDNSTKVATTAYVDAAIPDVSGFSTTDEKLKTNLVSDTNIYYPIFGNASSTAENKQYSDAFKFQQGSGALLTIGKQNDKIGTIQLWYGNYITYLEGNNASTANHYVFLPAQQGTLALTSDIPQAYSSTNTGGYLTMATLPIYDGTVV